MNKKELIKHFEDMPYVSISQMGKKSFIDMIEQLDDPEPIKLRDVIARIKQLDIGTRKVWLDEFLNELGGDYGTLKYKAGYEQGKLEGEWVGQQLKDADKIRRELNKPVVPQFVADWIEVCKEHLTSSLYLAMTPSFLKANNQSFELTIWIKKNEETFARAWLDGYTVEKEKRYRVKMKGIDKTSYLNHDILKKTWFFSIEHDGFTVRTHHTRKEIEEAGFGDVFDSPLFEVEEVTE